MKNFLIKIALILAATSAIVVPAWLSLRSSGEQARAFQFPTVTSVGGLPVINVTTYGAVHDGVTNDRAAIKAAFVAASGASGSIVYFPPGVYIVDKDPSLAGALDLACSNCTLQGVKGQSIIRLKAGQAATPAYTLRVDNKTNVTIREMVIDGNWGNAQTTLAVSEHNASLPGSGGSSTITVKDTTGFPASGFMVVETLAGPQALKYTAKTSTTFTGCAGGTGVMQGGNLVGYADTPGGINHTTQATQITTIASGSNGQSLPGSGGSSTINVASAATFDTVPGNIIVTSDYGPQTINCTGKTSTTLTGCTLGTGVVSTGAEVANNADPQSHSIMIRGVSEMLIDNSVFQQAYGDCIWVGYASTSTAIPTRHLTVQNSQLNMCGRQGMSLAQAVDGVVVENVRITNAYAAAFDMEPIGQPVRDVTIAHSTMDLWWGRQNVARTTQYTLTLEGGKTAINGELEASRKIRVHDNTIYGSILIETTTDTIVERNRVIADFNGNSAAPIFAYAWNDDLWILNNYIYDRTSYPSSPSSGFTAATQHDAAIQIQYYAGGTYNKQPANVHVVGNTVHVRNGHHGIKTEGGGGYAYSSVAAQSPYAGNSTATAALSLTDSGATWTTDQWAGYTLLTGGYVADVTSNTATTLTLFPVVNMSGNGTQAWFTPQGDPSPIPGTGAYRILQNTGIVDISDNIVDTSNDGNGAGAYGIFVRTQRANSRVRIRDNTVKNANTHSIEIGDIFDSARTIQFLQVTGNHGFDDQLTPTCADVVHFVTTNYLNKMAVSGNVNDAGCTTAVAGLTAYHWLISDGNVQAWAGYASPESVVAAPIGSTYQRLDGSGQTASYVKGSGTGNTGWLAADGAMLSVAAGNGITVTGTTAATIAVTGLAAAAANAIHSADGAGNASWTTTPILGTTTFSAHVKTTGTAPSLASCGAAPTIVGNDVSGVITPGAGATGCIATFAATYTVDGACTVTSQNGTPVVYSHTATTLVLSTGTVGAAAYDYHCLGH